MNFKNKGITLIALVITIIVLLILAGVSISMLTGDNGILTQARKAQEETEKSNELEEVKLAINAGISENLANNTEINEAIRKELVKTDENATVTGEGTQKDIKYKNNMYTVDIKIGQVEQMTEEEFAKRSIKIKVNTGDDGKVVLPIGVEEACTIDWGDGVTTGSKKENVKIATTGEIKLAEAFLGRGYTHIYEEKNVERTVTIKGSITIIDSYCCTEDEDGNEYEKGLEKIIEIEQWGETGLNEIFLVGLSNLTKIALPSKNSFIGVDNFDGAFAYCTKLESIPEGFFDNCPNLSSFYGTFEGCTGLTGKVPELWKRGTNSAENDYKGDPNGESCFYQCEGVSNYDEIPEYWKEEQREQRPV